MEYKSTLLKTCYCLLYLTPFFGSLSTSSEVGERYMSYYDAKKHLAREDRAALKERFFGRNVTKPTLYLISRLAVTGLYSLINPGLASLDISGMGIGMLASVVDIRARERKVKDLISELK